MRRCRFMFAVAVVALAASMAGAEVEPGVFELLLYLVRLRYSWFYSKDVLLGLQSDEVVWLTVNGEPDVELVVL